jgi:hypothetical protein
MNAAELLVWSDKVVRYHASTSDALIDAAEDLRVVVLKAYRCGLNDAREAVGGPSFITKKKLKDLIVQVDRVLDPIEESSNVSAKSSSSSR